MNVIIDHIIDPATIGGLFLIFGAFAIAKGSVYWSVALYFFADLCWLGIAVQQNYWLGAVSVSVGIIAGGLVWLRMHKGLFYKSIKK